MTTRNKNEWTLGDILEATAGQLLAEGRTRHFTGISTDSRSVSPGNLFVALQGEHFDGHAFIGHAVENGATGVMVTLQQIEAMDYHRLQISLIGVPDTLQALGELARSWRRRYAIPVVAITGSNGKTTTKEMVAAILNTSWRVLKSQGTYNNLVGLPLTLLQLTSRHQGAVVELGMNRPGEIKRLTEIASPDVGLITNIQAAHLEGLQSIAGVQTAKGELFAGMPATATIVVNQDDPLVRDLASLFHGRQVSYSTSSLAADVVLDRVVATDVRGSRFFLRLGGKTQEICLPVIGRHQMTNAVAAAAVAWNLGFPPGSIAEALGVFEPVDKRMQVLTLADDIRVINDTYNANPGSMTAALETLVRLKQLGRAVAVLGDMLELGEESATLHRELGLKASQEGVEHLLAMGEQAGNLLAGAREAGMASQRLTRAGDHRELALQVQRLLKPGDWVLVKGSRGMRMEKVVEILLSELKKR